MNRHVLLLTAVLGMTTASAQGTPAASRTAQAVTSSAAGDPQLSKGLVTFDITRSGSNLSTLLIALAKSAGYEIIIEPGADAVLSGVGGGQTGSAAGASVATYNFSNRPFNEVWPLVLDVYGLSYQSVRVGNTAILRVSLKPVQRIVKLPAALLASEVERRLKLSFGSLKTVETTNAQSQAGAGSGTASNAARTVQEDIILDSATLKIVAEPASNSVIIRGTNQEVADVERLLGEIVAAQPAGTPTAQTRAPAAVQRIYTVRGQVADVTAVLAAQYPELRVTPVGQTGQVILNGQPSQIDAALALLGQVDRSVIAPGAVERVYSVRGDQGAIVTFLRSQYPELRVTPVGQTGQLLLSGAQSQLDTALTLLGQVDRSPQSVQTVQRVFQLVNSSAEEVKDVLLGQAEQANTTVTTTGERGSAATDTTNQAGDAVSTSASSTATQGQRETVTKQILTPAQEGLLSQNPPTIIADKRTNTLIVRGTPEQVTQIADLIPQLDQVVPQINVQVRIQEVTERAVNALGLNWRANFGGFNVSVGGSTGLAASFNPTQSFLGFNIFPTLTALETQGLTKRIYDGNVSMQSGQRSLGSTSRSQAQNASAGAAASVKSGGRLEINIPSDAGNIEKQIDYGVNFDFFDPQVAPDGTITLRVRGQVNTLNSTITPASIPNVLDFSNSEAQSTITFKSGQTVLMSGLLGKTETNNRGGVPFLSSLPVIGPAFGEKRTEKTETQLLVIITGTVVK